MFPNKQKQRFPATPGIAVSSLCIYKDTACRVSEPPSTDRWTKFVHPTLLTGHFEPLLPMCGFGADTKCPHQLVTTSHGKVALWQKCATGQAVHLWIQMLKTDFQRDRQKSVFTRWDSFPNPCFAEFCSAATHRSGAFLFLPSVRL